MRRKFQKELEAVVSACGVLAKMEPVARTNLPRAMPECGVYLFSEGRTNLYVGRSDRLRARILEHGRPSSQHNVAAFAFRLALEVTGNTRRTYSSATGRRALAERVPVREAFLAAKERVAQMRVRWIEECDPLRQALLEIYVAVTLRTNYNSFENT